MSERLYYDPRNPDAFISESAIRSLSAAECAAASEQLDQKLLSVLQDIDENFVRATRIITERILPALEAYGEASRDIWQSVKFWQTFFEAAAGIRFSEEDADGVQDTGDTSNVSHDVTLRAESPTSPAHPDGVLNNNATATKTQPVFSSALSDLEVLQKEIREQFGPLAPSPQPSVDLTGEDILQPELETMSLGDLPGTRRPAGGLDKGKGRAMPSPRKQSDLLQHVLLKNRPSSSAAAATSTPSRLNASTRSVAVPAEAADPAWSGLLDLGKTPLAAFSPAKRTKLPQTKETNDSFDIEPPLLHHFSLPRSRAALARTPAREAAQLVARDALEAAALKGAGEVDSPLLEPPSVLRNWATRGYGGASASPSVRKEAPSPLARKVAPGGLEDDEDEEADFNDSLVETEAPWEEMSEEGGSVSFAARRHLDDEDGPLDDTVELDLDAVGEDFAPPEDTLFGGRRATLGGRKTAQLPRTSADFRLRGPQGDEMATLHGGALSDAQPFQRSPLAGRDAKYGL